MRFLGRDILSLSDVYTRRQTESEVKPTDGLNKLKLSSVSVVLNPDTVKNTTPEATGDRLACLDASSGGCREFRGDVEKR